MWKNAYYAYYLRQAGGGCQGPVFQRGNGIGSIFKGLVRCITPICKPAVKAVGKEAFGLGTRMFGDISTGQDPKSSLKRNVKLAGSTLLHQAGEKVAQFGSGKRKRKASKKRRAKRRKTKEMF